MVVTLARRTWTIAALALACVAGCSTFGQGDPGPVDPFSAARPNDLSTARNSPDAADPAVSSPTVAPGPPGDGFVRPAVHEAPVLARPTMHQAPVPARPPEQVPAPSAGSEPAAPAAEPFAIDLPTALRLANAGNPQILFARERIAAAQALENQASVLWLPHLRVGPSWTRHDGQIQDTRGDVITVSRSALFAGGGVGLQTNPADAYFEPLAARQIVAASAAGHRAVSNETLLSVAVAYWDLVRAQAAYAIAQEALANTTEVDKRAQGWAKVGKLKTADADRVTTDLQTRRQEAELAQQDIRVASAQLARLLRLDPFVVLLPSDGHVAPVDLVESQLPPGELAATALSNRPELAESRAVAQAAGARLQQAQVGPLVPSLVLDYSAGGFGGGPNGFFGDFDGRSDATLGAVWQLRNLGLGDRGLVYQRAAELRQSQWQVAGTMDRVVSETAQAAARVQARRGQLDAARLASEAAARSFERNLKLFADGGVELILPIEVLQSVNALAKARRDQLDAITGYNQAQWQLHWALGYPLEAAAPQPPHQEAK